jgi:hypothetical protein
MRYQDLRRDMSLLNELLAEFEEIVRIEKATRESLHSQGRTYLNPPHMFREIREEAVRRYKHYAELRTSFARKIPTAVQICEREGVAVHIEGRAALLEGATSFSDSVFALILDRPSDLVDFDTSLRADTNQAIGALETKLQRERRRLTNPLNWIKAVIVAVVRLPYTIISMSGFDVAKVEDHLIARVIHLVYVVALLLILIRLGLTGAIDLSQLIGNLVGP